MKTRVLDLLACPGCSGDLNLDTFVQQGGEIAEGKLECIGCHKKYPVIGGVPRVLLDHLMDRVHIRYSAFFQKYPGIFVTPTNGHRAEASTGNSFVIGTQRVYSYQHNNFSKLEDQEHLMPLWTDFFFDRVAVEPTSFFGGKVGLEAGSGEGRYLLVASQYCSDIVGLDLSEGVDKAYARNRERPNVHVVQGDIHNPPFHKEVFDFVYSTGVLMILPVPKRGFESLLPILKPDAPIVVWVYNLDEANLVYRISHFTAIHKVVKRFPHPIQVATSYTLAAALQLFAFIPVNLATRIPYIRRRMPPQLTEVSSLPFHWKVKEVHDRTTLPVIHFISRDELDHWYKDNQLADVKITSERRGLTGVGRKAASTTS